MMPETPRLQTVRIFVHGFVQGVGYRRWLQGEAETRGLYGWARNCSDGTVEAILHGEMRTVDDLVRACRHGPAMARVDKVLSEPAEYDGLESFRIEKSI
ncbi:MAG: acylphosphatase [Alphaproteobacteria bacterium]|nr:acylphosphatase [Alphaproteobacteria bacterium]